MAAHYGVLEEFRPEAMEIWTYLERVDLFFMANETPGDKQVYTYFLECVGCCDLWPVKELAGAR